MRRHARVHTPQFAARTNSDSSGEDGEVSPFDPSAPVSDSPMTSPSVPGSASSGGAFNHAHSSYGHSSAMDTN